MKGKQVKTLTKTEEIISSMMKENTGAHLLDSGGAYGRNHERNQGREFESEPRATLNTWGDLTISLYYFLNDRLTYLPKEDEDFHDWAGHRDEYWLTLMEEYPEAIGGKFEMTINSYNHESLLSQVIQYVRYTNEAGDARILLQVHGGCDVRGGYTAPRVFEPADPDIGLFLESASIECSSDECDFELEWSGGEFLQDRSASDFKLWEYCYDLRKADDKMEFIPCPECGAKLEADAWNTI